MYMHTFACENEERVPLSLNYDKAVLYLKFFELLISGHWVIQFASAPQRTVANMQNRSTNNGLNPP